MMSPPAPRLPLDLVNGVSNASHQQQQQQASSPLSAPPISASSASGHLFARAQSSQTAYVAPSTPASDSFTALLGVESPGTLLRSFTAASMPPVAPTMPRDTSSQSLMNPPRAPSRASSKVGSHKGGHTGSASDDEQEEEEEEEEASSPLDEDEEEEEEDMEDEEENLQQKPPSHWPLDASMLGLPFTPGPWAGTPAAATATAPQADTTPGGGTADAPTPGVAELDQIIGHLINYIGTTAPSSWDAAAAVKEGAPSTASPSAAQMQEQVRTRRSAAGGGTGASSSNMATRRTGKAAPVHPVVLANLIARINGQPIAGELPPMSELDPAVVLQGLLEWREQRHEQHRGLTSTTDRGESASAVAATSSSATASNAAASKHFNTWAHDQAKLQREQAEQQAVFDEQLRQVVNSKEAVDAAAAAALDFDAAAFSFANFDFGENDDVDEDPDFDPEVWTRAFGSSPVSILTPLPGFTPQAHGGTPVMQQQQQQLPQQQQQLPQQQQRQQQQQAGHGLVTPSQLQGHTNLASLQRGSHSDAGTPYGGSGALDAAMAPPSQAQQQQHRSAMSLGGGASPADALSPLVWGNAQVDLGGNGSGAQAMQQQQQQASRANVASLSTGGNGARREAEGSRRSSGESQSRREESNRQEEARRDERRDHHRARGTLQSSRRRCASPARDARHARASEEEEDDADSSPSKFPSAKGKSYSSRHVDHTQRERKAGRPRVAETAAEREARRKEQNRLSSQRARAKQKEKVQLAVQAGLGGGGGGSSGHGEGTHQLLSENRFLRKEVERLRDENAQLRADLALEQRLRGTAMPAAPLPRTAARSATREMERDQRTSGRSRRDEREEPRREDFDDTGGSTSASVGRWARASSRYVEEDNDSIGSYYDHRRLSDAEEHDYDHRGSGTVHDEVRSYCSALEYSDDARPPSHRSSQRNKRSGGAGARRATSPDVRPAKRARPKNGGINELDVARSSCRG